MNKKITALPFMSADIYDKSPRIYAGGSALAFAVHASEFTGVDVILAGAVGKDEQGDKVLSNVSYRRIDIEGIKVEKKLPTATRHISLNSDGSIKECIVNDEIYKKYKLSKSDKNALMISDVVFTVYGCPAFDEIAAARNDFGFKLAVDLGEQTDMAVLEDLAKDIDFMLLNLKGSADEASNGIYKALKGLSARAGNIINIINDTGSITFVKGEETALPATVPDDRVDYTGFFDSYHAAFICSFTVDNDITKAMQQASDLAAITVEHLGEF